MDGALCLRRIAWIALVAATGANASAQHAAPTAPVTDPAALIAAPLDAPCPPGMECGDMIGPGGPWNPHSPHAWGHKEFELRHSSSHGRAMGPGDPLRGTSWMNRPVSFSLDVGALFMASRPAENVRTANDTLGAVGVGWDWDHYWGSQMRVTWSTPELINTEQTALSDSDNLFIADISLLYYPWGDSRTRPYWRFGLGLTDVEYTNDFGRRQQANMMTIPIGVGVKRQLRRQVAWRLEFMDNIGLGANETDPMHNFTLTTGFEWRFGGAHDTAWGYRPRTGAW